MKVKDLKIGDICYCVHENGFLSIFEVVDIKFAINNTNLVRITFNKKHLNDIFELKLKGFQTENIIAFDEGTIYLTKEDAREAINDIIEICKESLAYL